MTLSQAVDADRPPTAGALPKNLTVDVFQAL
jgi:hypothetical protein